MRHRIIGLLCLLALSAPGWAQSSGETWVFRNTDQFRPLDLPLAEDLGRIVWATFGPRVRAGLPGEPAVVNAYYHKAKAGLTLEVLCLTPWTFPGGKGETFWGRRFLFHFDRVPGTDPARWRWTNPTWGHRAVDRLTAELAFWNAPTAWPAPSDETLARTLLGLLTDPSRVQPQFSEKLPGMLERTKRMPAERLTRITREVHHLGVARYGPSEASLWLHLDHDWLLLVRYQQVAGRWLVRDWLLEPGGTYQPATARLCAIPIATVTGPPIGGAGSPLSLTELGGTPTGQLVRRLLRFLALPNADQFFASCAPSLGEGEKAAFWQGPMRRIDLAVEPIITQSPTGRLTIVYKISQSQAVILSCDLKPDRLVVQGWQTGQAIPSAGPTATIDPAKVYPATDEPERRERYGTPLPELDHSGIRQGVQAIVRAIRSGDLATLSAYHEADFVSRHNLAAIAAAERQRLTGVPDELVRISVSPGSRPGILMVEIRYPRSTVSLSTCLAGWHNGRLRIYNWPEH